jgi:hypothetical protein
MAAPRTNWLASKPMTVYDGAVRITGKDGRELQAWRVVVYQQGVGLTYATVTAPSGLEAADRARRRWPTGPLPAK